MTVVLWGTGLPPHMKSRPPPAPSNDYGARLLSCAVLALVVTGFFWAYGAIAHRESLYYVPDQALGPTKSTLRDEPRFEAPTRDVTSPAAKVAEANALPHSTSQSARKPSATTHKTKVATAAKEKHARDSKQVRIARTPPRYEGWSAYAQAPPVGFAPFGGF